MSNFQRSLLVILDYETKLLCSCGHENIYTYHEGFDYIYKNVSLPCEKCGNEEHFILYPNEYNRMFNSVDIYENGDKVSLVGKVGAYFWNKMIDKPTYTDQSFRLTFNTKTGHLYLVQGKKVRNVTYGTVNKTFSRLFIEVERHYLDKLIEFVRLCFLKRGVIYRKVEDFVMKPKYEEDTGWIRFWDAMLYARFPQLQNIPLTAISFIPPYVRKQLDKAHTKREIYRVLFGTNAKTVLKRMKEPRDYFTLHVLSQAFKLPDNLNKMLDLSITKKVQNIGTKNPFEEITYVQIPIRVNKYSSNIFDSYDYYDDGIKDIIQALKFLVKVYKETPLVAKLQKEIKLEIYTSHETLLYGILRDIYRMYKQIRSIDKDYQVNWKRSFIEIHDYLSKDISRYKEPNEIIQYKDEEFALEKQYGEYSFKLAPDTNFLVQIGNKLNICVGGYGKAAVKRKSTISVLYKNDHPIACIELDRKRVIKQAKLSYNRLPEQEEAKIIRTWAKENKLIWNRCMDLRNAL